MSITREAAQHLSAGQETNLTEILAMLNYDASQFNAMVEILDKEFETYLCWRNQGTNEIWDGAPSFTGGSFIYEGNSEPSGMGRNVLAILPPNATFDIVN